MTLRGHQAGQSIWQSHGHKVGDQRTLRLIGVGENPRLLALQFEGVGCDIGQPHAVIYGQATNSPTPMRILSKS